MENIEFYNQSEEFRIIILESTLGSSGECISVTSGMCGEIYVFDRGSNTVPRYTCVKMPKPLPNVSNEETAKRFVRELRLQLSFSHNTFVHWITDLHDVRGVPAATFRYWTGDLNTLIIEGHLSLISKLSILAYTAAGLKHCYGKGLVAHQDIKPANIFIKDIKDAYVGLPDLDIYKLALIADFGLANAAIDYNVFEGSRPYMAPEQWNKEPLSAATDIFALGVIFYELITNGYHPVGIKLNEHWPVPKNGNSKKWTQEKPWKNWVNRGILMSTDPCPIPTHMRSFIIKMMAYNPLERPTIQDVINFLFKTIKDESNESYTQISFLIDYFAQESNNRKGLEEEHPTLYNRWKKFEAKFG